MKKRRAAAAQRLRKERGIWVVRTGAKISMADVNRIIRRIREERYALSLGRELINHSDLKLEPDGGNP